jgi:glycerophosphoryl diester phosphodiesterase
MISRAASSVHAGGRAGCIDGNFAIECDIQLSSDGEAMVHRRCYSASSPKGPARCSARPPPLKTTSSRTPERMMTLGDLCALVAGRVPLVIEVKSH